MSQMNWHPFRLAVVIAKDFYPVYQYFILPIVIFASLTSLLFLIIRCKGERNLHIGDIFMIIVTVMDLVLSVFSVPTLIKLFFIDDGNEYLDHVSCLMLHSFLATHDYVLTFKSLSLSIMAFHRFILVSFPMIAKKILRKRVWMPFLALIFTVVISVLTVNVLDLKMDLISVNSYIEGNKVVQGCVPKIWIQMPISKKWLIIVARPVMTLFLYVSMCVMDVCLIVKMLLMIRWRKQNSSSLIDTTRNIRFLRSVFIMTSVYTMLNLPLAVISIYLLVPEVEEDTFEDFESYYYVSSIGHVLQHSINFLYPTIILLYNLSIKSFRESAKKILCVKCGECGECGE